jgi:hypothetical protein
MKFNETTPDTSDNPLVPSFSIQNKGSRYFLFPEELDYTELDDFLFHLDIERKDIPVDSQYLLTLFQQEMSTCSWMKWSSLDHILEKCLQWPLLSTHDLGPDTKESAWRRIRPAERSILLKNTWGLVKAYAVQGFIRGLELGLFTSIHIFIYFMLFYRLIKLIQTGSTSVDEFRSSFIGSDQKGIDSLVRLLAGLETGWLRLILTTPLIIGGLQSISSLWGARRISSVTLKNYIQTIDTHLQKNGGWLRDGIYEYLPGISSAGFLSLSGKLQKLESLVRWDGRLSSGERTQIFDALCRVVLKGKKSTQLNALQYLTKIAHGVGFKDLTRLKDSGYSKEELSTILYIKGKALELLKALPNEEIKESKPLRCQAIPSLPQRLYRQYLLWWLLGLKTHVLKQQLPAIILKGIKLAIELYFFQMIVLSILEAIRCPDKQGFELGFGYPEWATQLTTDCFVELIENQFRTANLSDSVDDLVAQIPLFNLADLDNLTLNQKNLTGMDMVRILTAISKRGAPLTNLWIYDYFADADMEAFTQNYLKTSQINIIGLGCLEDVYPGGEGLTSQGLQYLIDILPHMRLTSLRICFPNVDNNGIIALAKQLNKTKINYFYIVNANIDDTAGQIVAQTLAELPLQEIQLASSRLGDKTIQALTPLVQNNSAITLFAIEGDLITDQGAAYFAQMIQYSNLSSLELKSSQITDNGMISLADSLAKLPSLTQTLYIGSQSGEQGIIALSKQLNQTNFWVFDLAGYGNFFTVNSMRAFSNALPLTQITRFWLQGYQLNNETLILLADGINFSLITKLYLVEITFISSVASLGSSIRKLQELQFSSCNLTDDDLIALAPYLSGSVIQKLFLYFNNIGDRGVLALTQVLPFTNITDLSLNNNNITDIGAQALTDVYASTHLNRLWLSGNNISSSLLAQIESFQWQQYCQDQLCHANTQYNGYTTTLTSRNPSPIRHRFRKYDFFDRDFQQNIPKKTTWNNSSLIEAIDDKISNHQPDLLLADSITNWNSSILLNTDSPATVGTMIIGLIGFGLLLYKNATMVRNIIHTGSRLLQSYLQMTRDNLKITSNFYSFLPSSKTTRTSPHIDSPQRFIPSSH